LLVCNTQTTKQEPKCKDEGGAVSHSLTFNNTTVHRCSV